MRLRSISAFVLASSLGVASWGATDGPAEYAVRWTASPGLDSATSVLSALGLRPGKVKAYEVKYFAVTQPAPAPTGYKVVGRERGPSGGKVDATYKVRGPEPVPAEVQTWKCPLTALNESKAEVDVGFLGLNDVKRAFSVSCTAEKSGLNASLPAGYSAKPAGCTNKMERTKADSADFEVKVERWTLPKGQAVIEVSWEGKDSKTDFERFRDNVVQPLLKLNVRPLDVSKTELGSDC